MGCNDQLTDNILRNCSYPPKRGLDGGKAVLINFDDIDWSATVKSNSVISDLVLFAGKTGFKIESYKDLMSSNSAYAPSTEDIDGFLHNFVGRLSVNDKDNAERATELKNGRFVVVYESRYKGENNESAFKVLGAENGLRLSEMIQNTAENSGSITFILSTLENDYEQYVYNTFFETDYATSKATYESLFAQV